MFLIYHIHRIIMLKLARTGKRRSIRISRWLKPDENLLGICSENPATCGIDQKISDVLETFAKTYRRLPAIDEYGYLRGMVSSTDILKALGGWKDFDKIAPRNRLNLKVRDVMNAHVFHLEKNTDMPAVLAAFRKHRRGAYPVVYRKKVLGIVTEWDIVKHIKGRTGVKVSDIMVRKPLVAQENYSVAEVARMLAMGGFRRLPVMKKGEMIGIITPRDILKYLYKNDIPDRLQEQRQSVKNVMEKDVASINKDEDVYEAVKVMVERRIGGLPVVEGSELLGIITERDIVDIVEL